MEDHFINYHTYCSKTAREFPLSVNSPVKAWERWWTRVSCQRCQGLFCFACIYLVQQRYEFEKSMFTCKGEIWIWDQHAFCPHLPPYPYPLSFKTDTEVVLQWTATQSGPKRDRQESSKQVCFPPLYTVSWQQRLPSVELTLLGFVWVIVFK